MVNGEQENNYREQPDNRGERKVRRQATHRATTSDSIPEDIEDISK